MSNISSIFALYVTDIVLSLTRSQQYEMSNGKTINNNFKEY
jgi:hypothetical protein